MTRRSTRAAVAAVLAFGTTAAFAEPVAYRIDPTHTDVFAQWNHFGYSHPSIHFGQVAGTIVYDADNPAGSSVEVTLPMDALSTRVAGFDEDLRGNELFDVANFPEAHFRSTGVETVADGRLLVSGELTIKGMTHPVTLETTLNRIGGHPATGQPTIGFNATATVLRSDYGLDLYVPGISDEVRIRITTEASVPLAE